MKCTACPKGKFQNKSQHWDEECRNATACERGRADMLVEVAAKATSTTDQRCNSTVCSEGRFVPTANNRSQYRCVPCRPWEVVRPLHEGGGCAPALRLCAAGCYTDQSAKYTAVHNLDKMFKDTRDDVWGALVNHTCERLSIHPDACSPLPKLQPMMLAVEKNIKYLQGHTAIGAYMDNEIPGGITFDPAANMSAKVVFRPQGRQAGKRNQDHFDIHFFADTRCTVPWSLYLPPKPGEDALSQQTPFVALDIAATDLSLDAIRSNMQQYLASNASASSLACHPSRIKAINSFENAQSLLVFVGLENEIDPAFQLKWVENRSDQDIVPPKIACPRSIFLTAAESGGATLHTRTQELLLEQEQAPKGGHRADGLFLQMSLRERPFETISRTVSAGNFTPNHGTQGTLPHNTPLHIEEATTVNASDNWMVHYITPTRGDGLGMQEAFPSDTRTSLRFVAVDLMGQTAQCETEVVTFTTTHSWSDFSLNRTKHHGMNLGEELIDGDLGRHVYYANHSYTIAGPNSYPGFQTPPQVFESIAEGASIKFSIDFTSDGLGLQTRKKNPGFWCIDENTGDMTAKPDTRGNFTATVYATETETGQKAVVRQWQIHVRDQPHFAVNDWTRQNQTLDVLVEEIVGNPSERQKRPYAIGKPVRFASIDLVDVGDSDVSRCLFALKTDGPKGMFFLDPQTGEVLGFPNNAGTYTANLSVHETDSDREPFHLETFQMIVKPEDTRNSTFGPNGT